MPRYEVEMLYVATKTINAKDVREAELRIRKRFSVPSERYPVPPQLRSITEIPAESLRVDPPEVPTSDSL